jgi:tripartite-type tricarboxylate transporter receptor subunit TctC
MPSSEDEEAIAVELLELLRGKLHSAMLAPTRRRKSMKRLLLIVLLGLALPAAAQYPNRNVTMLAGYPAGGLVDIVARMVAENMKPRFAHGLVVVNRPGAAGSVAVGELTRSAPDGYTIILTPHSALVIAPQINDLPYKTPDEYDPFINLVAYYPLIAVRSESKYQTIQELLTDAKDNPGMIRVGSPGEGTSSHLNLEELMHHAGVKMLHVPYAGWAQSSVSLLGGHIEAVVAQPGELKSMVDGKRMRVLVAFHPQRHPVFPDVATARELGWNVSNGVWYLMIAPKGTPPAVVKYLHDSVKAAVEDPKFVEKMAASGVEPDYRPGDVMRTDLWREYKLHTEILTRIGMIKK